MPRSTKPVLADGGDAGLGYLDYTGVEPPDFGNVGWAPTASNNTPPWVVPTTPAENPPPAEDQGLVLPPSIQDALDTATASFDTGPAVPEGFFSQPASLPEVLGNVIAQTPVTPQGPQPSDYLPSSLAPVSDITIAPALSINDTLNQIVNYVFGPATVAPSGEVSPAPSPANPPAGTGLLNYFFGPATFNVTAGGQPEPVVGNPANVPTSGPVSNDAAQGQIVTPDSKAQGQRVDAAKSSPSGIPAQVAGIIRGFNIPGLSSVRSDWATIALFVTIPAAVLTLLWAARKLFR